MWRRFVACVLRRCDSYHHLTLFWEQVRAMQVASFLRLLMGYLLPTRYASKPILAATNALCSRKVTRCLVSGLITKQS